jgi:hypothetical protein
MPSSYPFTHPSMRVFVASLIRRYTYLLLNLFVTAAGRSIQLINSGSKWSSRSVPQTSRPEIPVHKRENLFFQKVKETILNSTFRTKIFQRKLTRFSSKSLHQFTTVSKFGQDNLQASNYQRARGVAIVLAIQRFAGNFEMYHSMYNFCWRSSESEEKK